MDTRLKILLSWLSQFLKWYFREIQVMTPVDSIKELSHVWVFCDPMDCSPPGSSVHGILQTRIPERVAISFSRGYSQPRDWIHVSCIAGELFPTKPPGKTLYTIEWDKESPQVLSRCSVYVRHVSDLLLCSPTCNSTFVSCVCFIKCRYLYFRGISKTILFCIYLIIRSDQISHSVMSDSLWPHGL